MNVPPAKRFPYREITGLRVNKYTDSVISEMRRLVGDGKNEPSAELRKKTSRYWTSSGFLNFSEPPRASVMIWWEVKQHE